MAGSLSQVPVICHVGMEALKWRNKLSICYTNRIQLLVMAGVQASALAL